MTTPANTQTSHQQDAILVQLAQIPAGQVSTYGAIACAAGLPGYARFVGQVLRRSRKTQFPRTLPSFYRTEKKITQRRH